jgi:beta-glucosidase
MWFGDPLGRRGAGHDFAARFTMGFTPDVSGEWQFGVESVGLVTISLDGELALDNTDAPLGGSFFGNGRFEKVQTFVVEAGRRYEMVMELRHRSTGMGVGGLNVGAMAPIIGDQVADAVALAARSDISVLVVGTNDDWESEGWDRTDIELPGEQNRLISEVAKVSKRTVVVVNAGSPVAMPWLNEVDAVLYSWFPGQEFGEALVDVLTGVREPSGRLPVTLPKRLEDTPAAEHHPGRNGAAKYLEGRLIGYRWFDTVGREPLFPFGFGLGYANIEISDAAASGTHAVATTVTNSSPRDGVQVVQVYAHLMNRDGLASDEPDQRLVGFARVLVPAHSSVNALVQLDADAYRAWNVESCSWTQWSGEVQLRVGTSSRHHSHIVHVQLP